LEVELWKMMKQMTVRGRQVLPGMAGLLLLLAAGLQGCSPGEPTRAAQSTNDLAVHQAEVASGELEQLMARGETVYLENCAACHQASGQGLPGAFPPLAGSDYLARELERDRSEVVATALFGLSGPITVNEVEYNGVMPSMGHLSDDDLAAALTYVFRAWGNDFAAVSVAEVAATRERTGNLDRANSRVQPAMNSKCAEPTLSRRDLIGKGGRQIWRHR
jgi:mono/diheme cytochrome c family protein